MATKTRRCCPAASGTSTIRDRPQPAVVTPGTLSTPETPASRLRTPWCFSTARIFRSGGRPRAARGMEGGKRRDGLRQGRCIGTKEKFGDMQIHVEFADAHPAAGQGPGPRQQRRVPDGQVRVPGARQLREPDLPRWPGRRRSTASIRRWSTPRARRANGRCTTSSSPCRASTRTARWSTPAYITAFHNGVLVQNHVAYLGPTGHRILAKYTRPRRRPRGRSSLQDHHNPVRFRNVWVRPLHLPEAEQP